MKRNKCHSWYKFVFSSSPPHGQMVLRLASYEKHLMVFLLGKIFPYPPPPHGQRWLISFWSVHAWVLRRFLDCLWHRIRGSGAGNQRTRHRPRRHQAQSSQSSGTGLVITSGSVFEKDMGLERVWRAHKWTVSNISLMSLIELLSLINIKTMKWKC